MKRVQQLAMECGKREITLIYDLAIAKMTMEIQIEEAPKLDNIKDDSCTCYGEFSNSKIQSSLSQNNGDTNFNHSAFYLISFNQKLFFNFL